MPRRTSANDPADWLWIAGSDLEGVKLNTRHQVAYYACVGKLAEVVEKILKAELLRLNWTLEKTHDLGRLLSELVARKSPIISSATPLVDVLEHAYFVTRYPGFDLDDPDWPALCQQAEDAGTLLDLVQALVKPPPS